MKEHPLIKAIKLKNKAIKSGAHPKIISNIERIISVRAQKSFEILKKGELDERYQILRSRRSDLFQI